MNGEFSAAELGAWTRWGNGRLKGRQTNDLAEAAALLEVLRSHNTRQDLTIYIDNGGVVSRWERDELNDPKRSLSPG